MSDIRVSVQWKTPTVFAGEDIECTITFKNVAAVRNPRRSPSPNPRVSQLASTRDRWKDALPMRSPQRPGTRSHRKSPSAQLFPQPNARGHKPALSLSTSHNFSHPLSPKNPQSGATIPSPGSNKHRRSVSIVSIGGDAVDEPPAVGQISSSTRPTRGHARAASLQVLPRRTGVANGMPSSAASYDRAFTVPSPLLRSSTSFAEQRADIQKSSRPRLYPNLDGGLTSANAVKNTRKSVPSFNSPPLRDELARQSGIVLSLSSDKTLGKLPIPSPTIYKDTTNASEQPNSATRKLSPATIDDTPRSSGELYTTSNNSTETLASEYLSQENNYLTYRPVHSRQNSHPVTASAPQADTLMMGYAQIAGSFTLDGSLVSQTHFEEAKKKGIIGHQGGGGVVRSVSTKRESGLFGSLAWGNIGESLGGLLSSNEMSSIKGAKGSTDIRAIPIISTPQAVLFVDLRLGPGESRTYDYSHPLPKGIPPSYKGRAIKVTYSLIVGSQRAAKFSQQHNIQHADIPFRVLTGVNDRGEILGHDLMSPHTILSNLASVSSIGGLEESALSPEDGRYHQKTNHSSSEFGCYVQSLLNKSHQTSGAGLLSPTEVDAKFIIPNLECSSTMKESIESAIFRSNMATSSKRSANRFEITRNGNRVAVIMHARPAYRLGETIPAAVVFQDSDISCYSLCASLETSESIDPTIALRSKASIQRVTRRVHASQFEPTINANKVLFNPIIPLTSTPDFITSGINLEWVLRFEFVTSRLSDIGENVEGLTEEVARDERGSVEAALQALTCETFDVTVPLRVYGVTSSFDEKIVTVDYPI